MGREQIFGWTEPTQPDHGYVRTLMAFRREDGDIDVEVRGRAGKTVSVTVPAADLLELGAAALDSDVFGGIERAKAAGILLAETVRATGRNQMFYLTMMGDSTRVEVFPENPVAMLSDGQCETELKPRDADDDSPLEEAAPGEGVTAVRGQLLAYVLLTAAVRVLGKGEPEACQGPQN